MYAPVVLRARAFKNRCASALPVLVALVIGMFAAQPLLSGQLPRGADVFLHLYRIVALDDLIHQGILFTRWFPNLAFGYGYPIFQYYPPLPHYVAEAVHLIGATFDHALLAAFALGSCLGGVSVFGLARRTVGPVAALAAALTYAVAPYTLYNIYERAALAEFMALAFVPLTLALLSFAASRQDDRLWVGGSLAFAAVVLCHNITALLAAPVIALFALIAVLDAPRSLRVATLIRAALTLSLGLALSAFFWFPAFAERNLTRLESALSGAYDFHTAFVPFGTLFALPAPIDPALINGQVHPALGLPIVGLAMVGLISSMFRAGQRATRPLAMLASAVAVVCIVMTQSISAPVWEALPLVKFVLYPSRFLGLASVMLALLAGFGVHALLLGARGVAHRSALSLGVILAVVSTSLFWMFPTVHAPTRATAADLARVERTLGIVGTTSIGEYTPVLVRTWPADNAPLPKLMTDALPAGTRVEAERDLPLQYDVQLLLPAAASLTFAQFFFEGWRAELDGRPVPITPQPTTGLIQLDVPAGGHRIVVWFGTTPLRTASSAVSLIALAVLAVSVMCARQPVVHDTVISPNEAAPTALVLTTLVFLGVVKSGWLDRTVNPWRTSPGTPPVSAARATFDKLALFDVSATTYDPAQNAIHTTLLWQVLQPTVQDYSVNVQVIDGRGETLVSTDELHPGGVYPNSRWQPGQYARDDHTLVLPPGTPPGNYQVRVAVYPLGRPDAPLSPNGSPALPATVRRPQTQPTLTDISPTLPLSVALGAGLDLIGVDRSLNSIAVGDVLPVAVWWHARSASPTDALACWRLTRPNQPPIPLDCHPLVEGLPPADWQAGDTWRATQRPRIPPATPGGAYTLEISVGGASTALGSLRIDSPIRNTDPITMQVGQRADFADGISLIGFDAPAAARVSDSVTVTLGWLARAEPSRKYKVFVQLVDANGDRKTGHDGAPASGLRPTTTWITGEVLRDPHVLDLPSDLPTGAYRVRIGFYEEFSGRLLPLIAGPDSVLLDGTLTVSR